jgi:hypothetical protein
VADFDPTLMLMCCPPHKPEGICRIFWIFAETGTTSNNNKSAPVDFCKCMNSL